MPPAIWPPNPNFKSRAEEATFKALVAGLTDDCAVFANLTFYDEQHGDIEIDLAALIPGYGAVIIEVKGGNISYNGQRWLQTRKDSPSREIEPDEQVKKNQYAFRNFLVRRWHLHNLKTEWLLVFPDTLVANLQIPGVPRDRILDRAEVVDVADRGRKLLMANANVRLPHDPDWVSIAFEAIRGHSSLESNREVYLQSAYDYIKRITRERREILDGLQENDRMYFHGPAGCGKSWLAFAQAERWLAAGLRVGIVSYNRGIASYMNRKVHELDQQNLPAYVGTIHHFAETLGSRIGSMDGFLQDWAKYQTLILQAIEGLAIDEKFDAWIVDEAQDFEPQWWEIIKGTLKSPDEGKIAIFADPQQALRGSLDMPLNGFMRYNLKENLRNCQEIAAQVNNIVAQPLVARGPHGYEVDFVSVESEGQVIEAADDEVARLTDEEIWGPGQIALLTTKYRHPVHADKSEDQESYWDAFWLAEDVFYGTVKGFKGLERSVVVLAINGIHEDSDINSLLYVGMTRARDRLIIVGEEKYLQRIQGKQAT